MSAPPATSVHTLPTTIHGRYLVRPASRQPPAGVLIGFHGYGQNAGALLDDLERIPGVDAWTCASLQGLHRFYTRTGDVVASWMTREDRELAIADNIAYAKAVTARLHAGRAPLVFLGFSQGVAMAFRAAAAIDACTGVVALGGDVPPDVRSSSARLPAVLLARGADDEWYSREAFGTDQTWLVERGVDASICEFAGGHAWADPFREAAGQFLARIAGRA